MLFKREGNKTKVHIKVESEGEKIYLADSNWKKAWWHVSVEIGFMTKPKPKKPQILLREIEFIKRL